MLHDPPTATDLAAGFARTGAKAVAEILAALVIISRDHRGGKAACSSLNAMSNSRRPYNLCLRICG